MNVANCVGVQIQLRSQFPQALVRLSAREHVEEKLTVCVQPDEVNEAVVDAASDLRDDRLTNSRSDAHEQFSRFKRHALGLTQRREPLSGALKVTLAGSDISDPNPCVFAFIIKVDRVVDGPRRRTAPHKAEPLDLFHLPMPRNFRQPLDARVFHGDVRVETFGDGAGDEGSALLLEQLDQSLLLPHQRINHRRLPVEERSDPLLFLPLRYWECDWP